MNNYILAISISLIFLFTCCEKQQDEPAPGPEREITLPEQIEKDITDILGKNWIGLADTLQYFDSTMLSQGKYKGIAPDGVYYELKVNVTDSNSIQATFTVQDSIWINAVGQILPFHLDLRACDTDFSFKRETLDTTSITADKIQVRIPVGFILSEDNQSTLLYWGQKVGYITLTEFENPDYTTGRHIIVHYYNDSRTFSYYDNGLSFIIDYFSKKQEEFEVLSENSLKK